jgi:ribosomal protein S27E
MNNSDSVPLQQFFRRQSDNLNDNRHNHTLHNLYNVITGYNSTMRIYNENMTRFLSLIDEYRRDIHTSQPQSNMNQYLNSNIFRTNQNNQNVHNNTTRTQSEHIGANQSGTFFQPATIFSTLFPDLTTQFTDVVVRPTQGQINNATRTIIYRDNLTLMNTRCPITMEDFINGDRICMIRYCRHCFRESAIMDWFQTNVRCPVCRHDIREISNNGSVDISANTIPTVVDSTSESDNNTINLLSSQIRNLLMQTFDNQITTDISRNNTTLLFDIPIMFRTQREVTEEELEAEIE